jgi:SNF family Na+-dependent transporter
LIQIKVARRRKASAAFFRIITSEFPMMDVVMLAIGFVFFALSIGYAYACDRL